MTQPASPLRFALAGMIAMAVAMGIGRFVYTPILPGMMDEIGLSASDAGLIASANYLGYLLGAFAAAGAWAHGRERMLMLVALAANAALATAMAVTTSLLLFLTIRLAAGLASAFMMVFLASIVFSHLAAAGRNDLQAMHFSGVGVGIAVSALMTGALVLVGAPWTADWLWAGILSAAGFVAVLLLIDRGPISQGTASREPPLPASRALRKIIVAYGLFGLGYVVTATFLVAIIRAGEGGRLFESTVWLATGLAGIPSVYLWQSLAKRWGLTSTFAVACVVEALGVWASVGTGGVVGPLAGGVLLGGTFIAITALGLQAGRLLAPEAPRRVFALMTGAFGIGQIIGPILAGIAADWTGSFFAPSLGAAAALLLSGVIGWSSGPAARSP
ncbi:MFS transporter [Mesorhizobium sp. L-8-10]|uniref:YbfB/YjiJ family MFS transporter n=1 Tax=Mesorhizobium sp. L-8-10 TaxID=2744523 RepID=UPI001936C025|nr:YbfB/YjiJ family MFS transporter [Mesorhizobium sp. L-8-10]BCH34225.1 MFS transporter [Mesorhizobium sp. L-8-10]